MYEPLFNLECVQCDREPVVAIRSDEGNLQVTHLCGVCFFNDRLMADWELWNDKPESME
jgi:hypothetical protein